MKDFKFSNTLRGARPISTAGAAGVAATPSLSLSHDDLLDLANSAWDLRKASFDFDKGESKPHLGKMARHVERFLGLLERIGLTIQDHYNQPFNSGQSLEVLAYQPTPGVERDIVAETIKPTVYLKGQIIQTGQVIVATPQNLPR